MKLVFYGGGHDEENMDLHREAIRLTTTKTPTIAYIPSQSYGAEPYFKEFVQSFKRLGIRKFLFCPVDQHISDVLAAEVFSSDMIHLSGGNTYYFLHCLRQQKLMNTLQRYATEGGVLTGLSAGAILMTPTIRAAGYPSFDCDDNDEGIRNLKALSLVDFEFFPHYKNSTRYNKVLEKESKKISYPLYACRDHSGIIVNGQTKSFIDPCWVFKKGKRSKVN